MGYAIQVPQHIPIYIIYTLEDLEVNHLKFKQWWCQLDDKAFPKELWSINSKNGPRTSRVYIYVYIKETSPYKSYAIYFTYIIYLEPN